MKNNYLKCYILLFNVLISFVIGMNGAESLYGGGGERDPGRTTHILHPLHLTNAPLKNTEAKRKWTVCTFHGIKTYSCLVDVEL